MWRWWDTLGLTLTILFLVVGVAVLLVLAVWASWVQASLGRL